VIRALGGQVNTPANKFDNVVYNNYNSTNNIDNYGVSGQLDYDFGNMTLTSITAYRQTKLNADQDVDFTSARSASGANVGQAKLKTFTQELRLASDFEGPFNFLLGGYYFDENVDTADQIIYGEDFREYANILIGGPVTSPPNDFAVDALEAQFSALTGRNLINQFFQPGQGFFNRIEQKDRAYSIFGNVDLAFSDAITLTLGANYTNDRKSIVTNSQSTDVFSGLDLTAIRNTATSFGIAQTIGGILGVPGGIASAAQVAGFAGVQPAAFAAIQAGAAAATAPILGLRPLQFLPPFQNCPNAVESCSFKDGDLSYSARLAVELSNTLNAYASYATGYKAASFNLSRDSRPTAADAAALRAGGLAVTNLASGSRFAEPEDSEVYELGLKGNWGIAAANLTFFRQTIKNFQTNVFTGTGFIFSNADKQRTTGVEFDGYVRPTDALTLSLAVTYLDPKYVSFVNSPFGDLSGREVQGIARLSSVIGAQYDLEIGNGDNLIFRGDFSYASPTQVVEGLPGFITTNANGTRNFETGRAAARPFQTEVNDLNASITYAFDMGLELSVWGRNLLDDRNITTIFDSVAQAGSISGYTNQPRTYGVSARFKF